MAHFVFFTILIFINLLGRWSLVEGLSCWKCIAKVDPNTPEPDFLYTCEADMAGFNDDCGSQAACVAREDWDESSGNLVQKQMYCVSVEPGGGGTLLPTGCLTHRLEEGSKVTLIKSCLCNDQDGCNKIGFTELEKILPTVGKGDDTDTKVIDVGNNTQSPPGGRSIAAAAAVTGNVAKPNKAPAAKSGHARSSRRSSKRELKPKKKRRKNRRKNKFREPYISTYDSDER